MNVSVLGLTSADVPVRNRVLTPVQIRGRNQRYLDFCWSAA